MTTLNTIIEEEKKEFDKRFMQDGELLTAFDGKDDASDIKSHLTTAMQRAYEAGKDERDTYWKERVRKEQRKHNCPPDDGNDYDQGAWEACEAILDNLK